MCDMENTEDCYPSSDCGADYGSCNSCPYDNCDDCEECNLNCPTYCPPCNCDECTDCADDLEIFYSRSDGDMTVGWTGSVDAIENGLEEVTDGIVWGTSNPNVMTVDSNGNLVAVGEGTVTIYVYREGETEPYDSVTFTVGSEEDSGGGGGGGASSSEVSVRSISLESDTNLLVGVSGNVTATVYPTNATNKKVTFSSTNPSVLSCTTSGKYTAISAGTARIIAKASNDVSAYLDFTVIEAPTEIVVNKDYVCLKPGCSFKIETAVIPDSATGIVSFYNGNPDIAYVDETGIIFAKNCGCTTIAVKSAVDPNVTKSITVCVSETACDCDDCDDENVITPPITEKTVLSAVFDGTMLVGGTQKIKVSINSTPVQPIVYYVCADEGVIKVDGEGNVVGVGVGKATINIILVEDTSIQTTVEIIVGEHPANGEVAGIREDNYKIIHTTSNLQISMIGSCIKMTEEVSNASNCIWRIIPNGTNYVIAYESSGIRFYLRDTAGGVVLEHYDSVLWDTSLAWKILETTIGYSIMNMSNGKFLSCVNNTLCTVDSTCFDDVINNNVAFWRIDSINKNYATYPCKTMRITQKYDGTFSHITHSTADDYKDYPIDDDCGSDERSYMYCPCDEMVVWNTYGVGGNGTNTIWLRSTSKVVMPCGEDYLVMMVMHPEDDDLSKIEKGRIYKRGEAMFREGKDGYATAEHFHISVGTGNGFLRQNGWIENNKGAWVIYPQGKSIRVEEAFFVDTNFTTIKNSAGIVFEELP